MRVINRYTIGFTLLEMIIVLAVMGVLAAALFAVIDPLGQLQKADDLRRKSDLATLQKGLEQYYQDFGKYPGANAYHIVDFKTNQPLPWGSSWAPYMTLLPKDPTDRTYIYVVRSDMQGYWIYASLERGSDPAACNGGNACGSLTTNNVSPTACGGTCNYVVSSPNVVK